MSNSKKAPVSIEIAGKVVTPQQIAAYGKAFAGQADILTVWANYAALHAVRHGNVNPLVNMFENEGLRRTSGKLTPLGKEAFDYIKAHAPLIQMDVKTGAPKIASVKATNPMFRAFVNPAELDADGKATPYPAGDFALSVASWRELVKPEKVEKVETLKATTVEGQVKKALQALEEKRLTSSAEEATNLLSALMALQAGIVELASRLAGEVPTIDESAELKLLESGRKGRSARAGGKVAKVAKAAE